MSRDSARIRGRAHQDPLSSKLALDFLFGALAATTLIYLLRLTPPSQDAELNAKLDAATSKKAATEAAVKVAEDRQVIYAIREHLLGFPLLEGDVAVVLDYSGSIVDSEGFGLLYRTIIEEVAFNSPDVKRVKLHAFNILPNMFSDPRGRDADVPQSESWLELEQPASKTDEEIKPLLRARGWPEKWADTKRGALFSFIQSNLPSPEMPGSQFGDDDNVGAALRAAVEAFADSGSSQKRNILLVGDGDAYSSDRPRDAAALQAALAKAKEKKITIHAIAAMSDSSWTHLPVSVGTYRALSDFYMKATSETGGTLVLLPFRDVANIKVTPPPSVLPVPPGPSIPPVPPPSPKDLIYQFEANPS